MGLLLFLGLVFVFLSFFLPSFPKILMLSPFQKKRRRNFLFRPWVTSPFFDKRQREKNPKVTKTCYQKGKKTEFQASFFFSPLRDLLLSLFFLHPLTTKCAACQQESSRWEGTTRRRRGWTRSRRLRRPRTVHRLLPLLQLPPLPLPPRLLPTSACPCRPSPSRSCPC